jgi:hypothetical protein
MKVVYVAVLILGAAVWADDAKVCENSPVTIADNKPLNDYAWQDLGGCPDKVDGSCVPASTNGCVKALTDQIQNELTASMTYLAMVKTYSKS